MKGHLRWSEVTPLSEGAQRALWKELAVTASGVCLNRLKLPRLARRASGSHGAGGAVVAGTVGCRYSSSASVQGKL